MVKTVFFDVGGVLGAPATSSIYGQLAYKHKGLSQQRFRQLLLDKRTLTDPKGTLEHLLQTSYRDLRLHAEEILPLFQSLPLYEENFTIARRLKAEGISIGIISDQIAETAEMLRQSGLFEDLFDPILFSPEVKLTKKTRAIFDLAQKIVDYEQNELLMIDDHLSVCDMAASAGWGTILYSPRFSLETQLKKYGLLNNA